MKLSPPQQDVVLRMVDGAKLYLTKGLDSYHFLTSPGNPTVRWATAQALKKQGAVELKEDNLQGAEYILTDAGREEASRLRAILEGNHNAQD